MGFRELYDAHFPLVWRALRRLGAPDADMMDLTQKVFLVAFTKLPEFEGRSTVATWLYAICNRVASEHRRSAIARNEIATDPATLADSPVEGSFSPTEFVLASQAGVDRILAKLSDDQRTAFLLYEVDELSGLEIAALLGVPVGTVRSRLRHARDIFRREMARLTREKGAGGGNR